MITCKKSSSHINRDIAARARESLAKQYAALSDERKTRAVIRLDETNEVRKACEAFKPVCLFIFS